MATDWRRPHRLKVEAVDGHPELAAVTCSCGWSVMPEANMAQRLGKVHTDRAFDKAARS
jgi:hypothetical protein